MTINIVGKNNILNKTLTGKLHMVDLAGSERVYKSEAEGERLKEACNINQSLTTLGKVLNGLAMKSPHIPYRESKLTHLLKDSLGGTAKTLLIIQCSPNPRDISETISTLQFGTRVMKVEKGKARQNSADLALPEDKPPQKSTEFTGADNLREITNKPHKFNRSDSVNALDRVQKKTVNPLPRNSTKSPRTFNNYALTEEGTTLTKFETRNSFKLEKENEVPNPNARATLNFDSFLPKNGRASLDEMDSGKIDIKATIESLHVLLDKTSKKRSIY